jgi:membrane protein implicated in regulation of membrane protease activity
MNSFITCGIVFLANGVTFFMVGLTTQLTTLWLISFPFMMLGIVFLAISKSRRNARGSATSS